MPAQNSRAVDQKTITIFLSGPPQNLLNHSQFSDRQVVTYSTVSDSAPRQGATCVITAEPESTATTLCRSLLAPYAAVPPPLWA